MINEEKFLKQINEVNPGRYGMMLDEMMVLVEQYRHDIFRMVYAGFKYGFLKGQRAAKAQAKARG